MKSFKYFSLGLVHWILSAILALLVTYVLPGTTDVGAFVDAAFGIMSILLIIGGVLFWGIGFAVAIRGWEHE